MDEDKKSKVIQLFKDNSTPKDRSEPTVSNTIVGDGNILGNNNNIIHSPRLIVKTNVTVEPGKEHITESQAATLKRLVNEVVGLEKAIKQKPKTFQAVWASLNKHCKVTQYRLIPHESYDKAEKYLRTWIGRLSSSKSAPKKAPSFRARKYAFIKANCKQLNLDDKLALYIREKFGVGSIKDLDDASLVKVYNAVASWKRKL